MNILDTLQYLKPDIKVLVWENDINKIVYNELETFRPTKDDILKADQVLVASFVKQRNEKQKQLSIQELNQQVASLQAQLNNLIKVV